MLKVLVCGGREFCDLRLMFHIMGDVTIKHGQITCLIQGDAKGADWLAKAWAGYCGIEHRAFPADWKNLGRGAGHARNQEMLSELPDIVIAFPGGAGTADMVRRSKAANIHVIEVTQ